MDVDDASQGTGPGKDMEEMRANYEKIVQKNQEELKTWHESKVDSIFLAYSRHYLCSKDKRVLSSFFFFFAQITVVQVQVTENTEALKEAKTQVSLSSRQMQFLEKELQSQIANVRDFAQTT